MYVAGIFSLYIRASLMTRSFCIEAAEAPSPVTLRTTTSNDDDIEKVLTTREIEDVVYQTVYACQNNVLQVSIKKGNY